jgi:hypothetical protein
VKKLYKKKLFAVKTKLSDLNWGAGVSMKMKKIAV